MYGSLPVTHGVDWGNDTVSDVAATATQRRQDRVYRYRPSKPSRTSLCHSGAVGLDVRLGGGLPGELVGPLGGGDPQGAAPFGVGVEQHEAPGDGLGVGSAVGDGVPPRPPGRLSSRGGEHSGPAGHGLEHRQTEASPMEG